MTHSNNHPDIVLVYIVNDHHYFPITDEKLKLLASKADRGGVDNLLKHISDLKWSRRHENIFRLKYVDDIFRLNTENHIYLLFFRKICLYHQDQIFINRSKTTTFIDLKVIKNP